MERCRAQSLTPVALAFIGDAVHSLYVRERIAEKGDKLSGTMHAAAARLVNAQAQAKVFDELSRRGVFTDEEADIARRARNAHLHSHAKSASGADYHKATALEAVLGYVHLCGDAQRESFLLALCTEIGETLVAIQQ